MDVTHPRYDVEMYTPCDILNQPQVVFEIKVRENDKERTVSGIRTCIHN